MGFFFSPLFWSSSLPFFARLKHSAMYYCSRREDWLTSYALFFFFLGGVVGRWESFWLFKTLFLPLLLCLLFDGFDFFKPTSRLPFHLSPLPKAWLWKKMVLSFFYFMGWNRPCCRSLGSFFFEGLMNNSYSCPFLLLLSLLYERSFFYVNLWQGL